MSCPPVVRRALVRVSAWLLVALVAVGVGGWLWSRQRLGPSAADTRRLVEGEARARMAGLTGALDALVAEVAADGALVERAAAGDGPAVAQLFSAVALDARADAARIAALTVYGIDGAPVAWDGRPSTLPASRLAAGSATFMLPTPLGVRLARVAPVFSPDNTSRRIGTVVAEAAVSTLTASPGDPAGLADWATPIAPVVVGPPVPHAEDPSAFDVTTADGTLLGTARIAPEALAAARARATAVVGALLWLTAAIGLAVLLGPLADWRALATSARGFVALSGAMGGVAIAAGLMAVTAIDTATLAWAREARFAVGTLIAFALAGLAATVVARWRALRAARRGGAGPRALDLLAHLVAGAVVGALALQHHRLIASVLPVAIGDVARFALTPVEPGRLAATAGLVFLHAAAALMLAAGLRAVTALTSPRRTGVGRPGLAAAVIGAITVVVSNATGPAAAVTLALVAGALLLAGVFDGALRTMRRGSQPARLVVLFAALAVPSLAAYPSLAVSASAGRRDVIVRDIARQVADQRQDLQLSLRAALAELDRSTDLADLVRASAPVASGVVPTDAAFLVWSRTTLATRRLTSSVELYDGGGRMVSRFALNLPETSVDQAWQETTCSWELFEEVSPFFAEERRLLHAGRGVCVDGRVVGSIVVHVVLDYANLPFLVAQNPYVALLGASDAAVAAGEGRARDDVAFVVYGWSRRPLYVSGGDAWTLPEPLFARLAASREPFWAAIDDDGVVSDVYLLSDRGAIYAIGHPRPSLLAHLSNVAELVAFAGVLFGLGLAAIAIGSRIGGRAPVSGRALFREVRASFSRTLFLAFVAAVVVPVVALALVTRAYMATSLRQDIEREATRTVLSASRVVEDFAAIESRGATNLPVLDDSLLVWLSRVIGEDINVFAGTGLLASSERTLFASGLLPTRTPGDTYRALVLEGRPTYLARESVGDYEYQVVSALVRVDDEQAIVSVPLTLRQRGIERQVDELDRRVLLAAIAFILLGSAIGYWAAERISDPVSRLTRATRRLAAGDLDAHVLVRTSDELGRLVEAFNGMADDLRRQRTQLERTNRLEAWAEMARQVAHDIKNPLTPIQLNAEHLRRVHVDRGRPLGALVDDCVNNILLQVRLLRQLASEFSSFASSPQARPAPMALAPLLDEILAPYIPALAGRITLTHEGAEGLTLHVDRVLLARALTNVIENALHAMPGDGRLVVRASAADDHRVRVDVADSGVGMDAEALGRIFEPYFSTKATGTGLGLTIARRNVELNGGTIEVASTPGVGTTVSIWLPAA